MTGLASMTKTAAAFICRARQAAHDVFPEDVKKAYARMCRLSYTLLACMIVWLFLGLLISIPFMDKPVYLCVTLLLPEAVLAIVYALSCRCPACGSLLHFYITPPHKCPYCGMDYRIDAKDSRT